jgi:penicillin-binding protein 1A
MIPGWSGAVAGKTGSTDNNYNAWFVGYTKDLATAVWMGSPGTVQHAMTNVGGITVYGGTYPAMIFGDYMKGIEADKAPAKFTPPDSVTTRPPRMLLIAGEQPVFEPSFSSVDNSPTGSRSGSGSSDTAATSPPTTARNRSDATTPTTSSGTDDTSDDNSSRTTRTSRPPRPRDITTLPT